MTEVIDRRREHDIEELREIIARKVDRELSIFELHNLLVKFGLENIEELTNQMEKFQGESISDEEKYEIIDRMNEIPDDSTFSEQDTIEIGSIINDGLVRRYLADTRKGD